MSSSGCGGMVTRASELSRVRRRAVSPASTASLKVARRFRSVGESGSGACWRSTVYESSVARARWSAALTDCGVVSRIEAAPAFANCVETPVGCDPVEPGAQRRPLLEAVEPAPGGEQCFLDEILGVLHGAE